MRILILVLMLATSVLAQTPITLRAACWQNQIDKHTPKTVLSNNVNGELTFAFPVNPNWPPVYDEINYGDMGYLVRIGSAKCRETVPSLTNYSSITVVIQVDITNTPYFNWNPDCPSTAAVVRPYFERVGDQGFQETYRWWSNQISYELDQYVAGHITMTVPLTGDHWSDVFGHFGTELPVDFAAAKADVMAIGMTFGNYSCFGHGNQIAGTAATGSGTAQFTVVSYTLNP